MLLLLLVTAMATIARAESFFSQRELGDRRLDPEASIAASYDALREVSVGLHHVDGAEANVAASVFVSQTPWFNPALDATPLDVPRTHLAYNCTSTSTMWNLQADPNVVALEEFQTSSDAISPGSRKYGNREHREVVATATLLVDDCSETQHSLVGRVIVGNSFFGAAFRDENTFFYVTDSTILNESTRAEAGQGSATSCRVRLELSQAALHEIYPTCRIKFHSTDVNNLIQTQSLEATAARNLGESSFAFVKDDACHYECGVACDAGDVDVNECWAKEDGTWTKLVCSLQFYEQNSDCTTECGYEGDDVTLAPNKCYACQSSDGSCASGYNSTDDGCCRVLECVAVGDSTISTPKTLSWNLDDDALTVSKPNYPLFEFGNCSNASDPSTDCCSVVCKNCFLNVSVASMFADVQISGLSYEEAIEMGLTGNANLEVAIFAPNGCDVEETAPLKNASVSIPLGETGLTLDIEMSLELRRKLSLQPHGSTAIAGASAQLESLTAGSLRKDQFYDVQLTSNVSSELAQSGIDISMELDLVPSFEASISLLKGVAQVGIQADFVVFLELNSTFQAPDPFPGLSTKYLDETSLLHLGDCRLPHFMEYNCYAGYGEVNISIPLSVEIPAVGTKTAELSVVSSSDRTTYSLFSGCVATAYDAEVILSTAIDAVTSLSDGETEALQTIVVWVVGMTDIDPEFVNVTSFSPSTGEISIQLSVPPSLGELYPTASAFVDEFYLRARNDTFTTTVSNYVGVNISAQCGNNTWGVDCNQACDATHCSENVTCNAVDGTTLSCGSCDVGYWGTTCQSTCEVPSGCSNARCDQTSGANSECVTCEGSADTTCGSTASDSTRLEVFSTPWLLVGLSVLAFNAL